MRAYENLITNLATLDQPRTKYGQINKTYFHKIFERLLVFDQLADDDFEGVLKEMNATVLMPDPAFEILFRNPFEHYIKKNQHHSKWQKIRQDYNSYIEWESKRRDKDNPYYNPTPDQVKAWDALPNFGKQKHNQGYQFDRIYQDAQTFAGEVYELTKNYEEAKDKDLFRARVNSLLVPAKLVFALNNNESINNFADTEITVTNIKLNLDAYKLAHVFLNRAIESLHKMRWSAKEKVDLIDKSIAFGNDLQTKLGYRISEIEQLFLLYIDSDLSQHTD